MPETPENTPLTDVLVIGAGAAGLCAAAELARAGLSVDLLEARDRVGGRIWSLHHTEGTPAVELGAEFVHGKPPEIFRVADDAHMEIASVSGEMWRKRNGRLEQDNDFFEAVDALLAKMKRGERDRSFAEFLAECCPQDSEARRWALQYVQGFHAAHPERIGVWGLLEGEAASEQIEGDAQFRVLNVYSLLVDYLHSQLTRVGTGSRTSLQNRVGTGDPLVRTRLNAVVKAVRWHRGNVTVALASGETLQAKQAIITLPLGVLKHGDVTFDPPLASKQPALACLEMGAVIRVTLRFRERFWDRVYDKTGKPLADLGFLFSEDQHFPTWWSQLPARTAVLTAWSAGPRAEANSGLTTEQVTARALDSLANILDYDRATLRALLLESYTHDWQNDPFCRGGYSYVAAGGDGAERELAAPLDDTLFFAGEAANFEGHNGTVNGAMMTGYRAARQLLEHL